MDVLRSAHYSRARVGSDNDEECLLRWHKCCPEAKAFPDFHFSGDPVWDPHPDEWTEGPGLFDPAEKWAPSEIPCPPGKEFHGKLEWFKFGIPQAVLDDSDTYAQPACPDTCYAQPMGVGAGMLVRFLHTPGPPQPMGELCGMSVTPNH
jgi:hypothetical protein